VPVPTVRAAAWALLDSLLPRPLHPATAIAALAPLGAVHGRLLGLVFRQLKLTVGAAASAAATNSSGPCAPPHPESVVASPSAPWSLSRESVGPVVPYVPLTIGTTFAFWLFRPRKGQPPQGEGAAPLPALKIGDRVVRGPDWCDDDEDGWVGNVGTVVRMETATAAIVEWDGRRDGMEFIYRCVGWIVSCMR
jgi:hypothetical protein